MHSKQRELPGVGFSGCLYYLVFLNEWGNYCSSRVAMRSITFDYFFPMLLLGSSGSNYKVIESLWLCLKEALLLSAKPPFTPV